jgi:L-histidine N-alpha-methyltransferase
MPTESIQKAVRARGGKDSGTEQEELLAGLTVARKYLPCKFFYDEAGSRLFERITLLPEYYPSRIEKAILERHAEELMRGVEGATLVEIGSGDCSKISLLLQTLPPETLETTTYVPVDVSPSAVEASGCRLRERFRGVQISSIVADFVKQIDLVSEYENKVICFFGSTIGNFGRRDADRFVARLGEMMKAGERLLLGLDMVKDREILERAYNDEDDITARFNKNILKVANRKIETDFDPDRFQHRAFFNAEEQRIEMHLVATRDMTVGSPHLDGDLRIGRGESIHTENSHKFTRDHIGEFASAGGLAVRKVYTDTNRWFSLVDYVK